MSADYEVPVESNKDEHVYNTCVPQQGVTPLATTCNTSHKVADNTPTLTRFSKLAVFGILIFLVVVTLVTFGATVGLLGRTSKSDEPPDVCVAFINNVQQLNATVSDSLDVLKHELENIKTSIKAITANKAVKMSGETCYLCEKGEPGIAGLRGFKGEAGFAGRPGFKGEAGIAGLPGFNGEPGISGLPGYKGDPGIAGLQGLKGDPGIPGRPGFKGNAGIPGKAGLPGRDGFSGPSGPAGPKGERGENGYTGPPGPPGVAGIQGLKGEKGDRCITANCGP